MGRRRRRWWRWRRSATTSYERSFVMVYTRNKLNMALMLLMGLLGAINDGEIMLWNLESYPVGQRSTSERSDKTNWPWWFSEHMDRPLDWRAKRNEALGAHGSLRETGALPCAPSARQRPKKRTANPLPCVFRRGARQRAHRSILHGEAPLPCAAPGNAR
jgi:hypothetical protein